MITKNSRNGLMESLLAPNDKRKDANALNLDETNPKRNNQSQKYALTRHKKF
ncbi:hypothetical protein [Helicobacter pylori]|uniref:hypothetical protein n=1 Tax=Helicobacter pylori TaxID=210 RepID=UPI0016808439|nr:hypothetical protein [Helicobacter pylori]